MIHVRLFGGVSVARADERLPQPVATQTRRLAILALVAQAGPRGMSRDRLHALLWPDATEEAARRGLTQALYALRTGLDEEALFVGVQQLQLNTDVAQCDVVEYEAAIAGGEFERAAALYAGPFLDGFRVPGAPEFERRVEELRDSYARRHDSLLEKLAQRATERGDHAQAADWWRQRAGADPLSARVAEAYMRALAQAGDVPGALRHARVHETLVQAELGSNVSASITALVAQLRASPPVAPPVPEVAAPAAATATAPQESTPTHPAAMLATPAVAPPVDAPVATAPVVATPHVATPPEVAPVTPDVAAAAPTTAASRAPAPLTAGGTTWNYLLAAVLLGGALLGAVLWLRPAARGAEGRLGDVALRDLRVAEPQRIAADEPLELDPAISPDGRTVAYVVGPEGALRLYVRQRDGSQALAVAPSVPGEQRRPHWSPDGTQLVFQGDRGLWLVPALGGSANLVVEARSEVARASSPTFSPDGRELAYVLGDTVFRTAVTGGAPQVVAPLVDAHSLAWSPGGEWIAAVAGNEEFVVGGRLDGLRGGSGIGNLAPSALVLLRAAGGGDASRAPVVRELLAATTLHASPAWLDRRTLIFVSSRSGTRDLFALRVRGDGTADGEAERLTAGLDVHSVSSAADGQQLAYGVFRQSSNVWSVPVNPAAPASLASAVRVTSGTQVIEGLDVSPDGAWLAYDSDAAGQQDIYRLSLAHGASASVAPERVVSAAGDDFHPAFSPDGRWLAFYSFRDKVRRAAIVPAAGGVPRLVHPSGPNEEEHSPVWSPDGRSLLFWRFTGSRMDLFQTDWQADSTWSASRRLTRAGGWGASFTAAGDRMAYFAAPNILKLGRTPDDADAHPVALSDHRADGLSVTSARVAPDGGGIIAKASDARGSGFWWFPLTGLAAGSPRLLLRFDDARRPSPRPEFASDGRHLFFTLSERSADVWAVRIDRR